MKRIASSIVLLAVLYSCGEKQQTSQFVVLQSLPVVEVQETSAYSTVQYPANIEGITDVQHLVLLLKR